nr:DUF3017 domain-containing protein [Naumannella cuiyingiana]
MVVLAGIAAGLVIIAVGPWRLGVAVVGAATILAGVLRLVLPVAWAGPLRVRSRAADTTVLLLAGALIIVLSVIIPMPG